MSEKPRCLAVIVTLSLGVAACGSKESPSPAQPAPKPLAPALQARPQAPGPSPVSRPGTDTSTSTDAAAKAADAPSVADQELSSGTEDTSPAPPEIAAPPPDAKLTWKEALELDEAFSTSIGSVSEGRLEGGIRFPDRGPGFQLNGARPNRAARYATVEVVQSVIRAAGAVEKTYPGSRLMVNDLGFLQGGEIDHHGSHEAGRDLDLLFYLQDEAGVPVRSVGLPVSPAGEVWNFGKQSDAADDKMYRFDVPRTWALFEALVKDKAAQLQRIFVVEHVRTLVLDHARSIGASPWAIERVGNLICQPNAPHDDHIHLRYFCSAQDIAKGCLDIFPIYPWQKAYLEKHGTQAVIAEPDKGFVERNKKPFRFFVPKPEQGATERVRAFLEARAKWTIKPKTGRPFCQ